MRKLLFSAFLVGLLVTGMSARVPANSQQGQPAQQSEQAKSVSGKVTTIGNAGHSFSVEADEGGNKRTIEFVVDKNTQIQGHVTTGTSVTVEYQTADSGQNVARTITVQGGK